MVDCGVLLATCLPGMLYSGLCRVVGSEGAREALRSIVPCWQ